MEFKEYYEQELLYLQYAKTLERFDVTLGGNMNMCKYENIDKVNRLDNKARGTIHRYFAQVHYFAVKELIIQGLTTENICNITGLKSQKVETYANDDGTRLKNLTGNINFYLYLWEKLKHELKQRKMDQVLACIKDVEPGNMTIRDIVIKTPKGVIKGLIERIYKKYLEEAFYTTTGLKRNIVCIEVEGLKHDT